MQNITNTLVREASKLKDSITLAQSFLFELGSLCKVGVVDKCLL